MKYNKLFLLPTLALALSLMFANATLAKADDSINAVKTPNCCCSHCKCEKCHCQCKNGDCSKCMITSRLNAIYGKTLCHCCK